MKGTRMIAVFPDDTPHTMAESACRIADGLEKPVTFEWVDTMVVVSPGNDPKAIERRLEELKRGEL